MPRPNGAGVEFPDRVRRDWGKRLKRIRGRSSQSAFAKRLGIDQATLSKIEHGSMKITDATKWLICGRLGVAVDDVFPMPPLPPALPPAVEQEAA